VTNLDTTRRGKQRCRVPAGGGRIDLHTGRPQRLDEHRRANAAGSLIGATWTSGAEPAAIVPVTVMVPGAPPRIVTAVGCPLATVFTDALTAYEAAGGRKLTVAGDPALVGVATMSMRLSLTMTGVGCGSKLEENSRSSMTTSPCTRVIPLARTCRASSLIPANGSSGVSVAPGMALASV
jgi:hypothetical protein